MSSFSRNIHPYVEAELRLATELATTGQRHAAFAHLERAHVLGQAATYQHLRVHWRMFLWGLQHRSGRECTGQVLRMAGAATKTVFGLVPSGNTGGSNVSPFKRMPVPAELEMRIQAARASVNRN